MDFNPEAARQILERIASGESLRSIKRDGVIPSQVVIYEWLASNDAFAKQYARAREDQADTLADEIVAIADDPTLTSDQKRVMVDARKWVACKLKPKKYGDKVTQELTGQDGGPVQIEKLERVIVRPANSDG